MLALTDLHVTCKAMKNWEQCYVLYQGHTTNGRTSVLLGIYLGCASCWYVTSVANIMNVLISRDSFKPQLHFITLLKILLINLVSPKSVLVQSFIEYSPCPIYDPQLMHWPRNVISVKHCGTSMSAPMAGRPFIGSLYSSNKASVASIPERK